MSLTRLFVDDSSLFYSVSSIQDIEGIINYERRILCNWAAQWLIKFNPLKTVAKLFTLKRVYSFPHLVFENTVIEFVENHKHLGLTLSNTGKWNCDIDNIAKASSKILGIMRKLKYTFSRAVLNQIYISYVLPVWEYSSVVWDGCSDYNTNTLEKFNMRQPVLLVG